MTEGPPSKGHERCTGELRFDPAHVEMSFQAYLIGLVVPSEAGRWWRQATVAAAIVFVALVGCFIGESVCTTSFGPCPSKERTVESDLIEFAQALEMYGLQNRGICPPSLEALVAAGLIQNVNPDPWGSPYDYQCSRAGIAELRSAGRDGVLGTPDDRSSRPDDPRV